MFSILLLVIIYISFISLGLPDSLLGAAWPSMYSTLNVPMHYAGFISMVITGATVVSAVFSEKVIRRFGTGIVTAVSVLTTAVSLIGFSISNSIYMLCFFAVPLGLGAGSVDAGLNNYVALHHKARHMSWLHCFWGIGT
ncbi:MAG: MFS transporter, partial [Treponema sp.]|nr:MFS transporter [Treponema sp.]